MVDRAFMWSIFFVSTFKMTHVVPLLISHIFYFAPIQLPPPPNTSRPWWCIQNSNGREGNNGNGRPIAGIANEEYYPRRYGGCARYFWLDVSHFFGAFVLCILGPWASFCRECDTSQCANLSLAPHLPPIARVLRFCLQCMCNSQW